MKFTQGLMPAMPQCPRIRKELGRHVYRNDATSRMVRCESRSSQCKLLARNDAPDTPTLHRELNGDLDSKGRGDG